MSMEARALGKSFLSGGNSGTRRTIRGSDLTKLQQAVTKPYRNFMVVEVNESCLRMAVMTDVFAWHRHPDSDELFLVLEGDLTIDFEERDSIILSPTAPVRSIER